ncbi:MAG: ATP-binding protein [Bryobacteraceae bacterium]
MIAEAEISARNDIAELPALGQFLARFWSEQHLPAEPAMDVNLAMEEVFANVVRYGYRDDAEHRIVVRVTLEGDVIAITVEDDGVAFDPLHAPPLQISGPPGELRVGGLGIHLVRHLMDNLEYRRDGNRNRLVMKKRIRGAA